MQTDIWALGVCVYEMVALKLPSDVPDIQQLGLNIFHDKVTIRNLKLIDGLFQILNYNVL